MGYYEMNYLPLCKDKDLIDLIRKMLALDFNKRITAKEALKHKFFD